ncbi:unnamed protein product [Lepeophtheirus salmonis]|uniref:(salmon louse) hypothetical protein n=1 Tax=Lepeophtheirus salmonis TaxID=72036 RepID=A0A0K2UWC8_LEPSM|nr:unnamed protein product [Lepeophtheirus salmonis]CAF2807292.1 unnamed protein product [Lepeophtheirus salmonis]
MGSLEYLCLQWNEYENNFKQGLSELRKNEELFDVTLTSGSKQIKAHKVILSACSPVFRSMIGSAPFQMHPLIYLRGINFNHLELLISFMYHGQVRVLQDELEDFISIAKELKINGLSNDSPLMKKNQSQPTSSASTTCSSTSLNLPYESPEIPIVNNDVNETSSNDSTSNEKNVNP